jgi:type IV pilus assembly protein PilY1
VAALNDIIEKTASFTAASVPSARTADGADFYQSYFFPRGGSAFWEGHVRAWHITADGEIVDANGNCALDDPTAGECDSGPFKPDAVYFWDAAEEIPQPDEFIAPSRNLYVSKSESFGALPTTWTQANIDAADLLIDVFTNPNQVPSDPTPNNQFYDDRGSRALNEEGLADEVVATARGCFFGTGVTDATKVDSPVACLPRPAMLGDIFHSNPAVVRSPNRLIFGPDAVSYNAFKTHYATTFPRDRVLYAGTNAGFLEAIHTGDWDTGLVPPNYDEGSGTELFGFMPWEARLKIKNLPVDPAYPRTHHVDGDTQTADVWFYNPLDPDNNTKNVNGSQWHTLLVGSMREGGHQYFGLDITNPNGSSHAGGGAPLAYPGYLWEFPTEADFAAGGGYFEWMGETWGKPIITKVRLMVAGSGPVDRWVAIVTAGYDPNGDPNPPDVTGLLAPEYNGADPAVDPAAKKGRAIFILDAMTGEVIAMKGYDPSSGDAQEEMKYTIVGRPSVLDLNADGFADLIYFVDMGGQVFKWVIADPGEDCVNDVACDPTQPSWPFKLFFTAPIGKISGTDFFKNLFFSPAAAYAGGQLWLAFGSGERRSLSFAGIGGDPDGEPKENNRYYVVSDPDPYENRMVPLPTLTEADLLDLTSDQDGANVTGRGFFFRVGNGEKFVTNTEIFAGHVIAATFKPTSTADPCTARGDGTLYVFDLLTGEGYFDDGGGNPTRGLDIGTGLPTDPQVSVGTGGQDNKVIIEKSGTDIEMIEEQNINVGGGLLYWRERF